MSAEEQRFLGSRFEIIHDHLAEMNPEACLADGFESALIGTVSRCGTSDLALYDIDLCIRKLIEVDGMEPDAALDFFGFNTLGAYVGEGTPFFAHFPTREVYTETEGSCVACELHTRPCLHDNPDQDSCCSGWWPGEFRKSVLHLMSKATDAGVTIEYDEVEE